MQGEFFSIFGVYVIGHPSENGVSPPENNPGSTLVVTKLEN